MEQTQNSTTGERNSFDRTLEQETGNRRKRLLSVIGWNRAKRNVPAGRHSPRTRGSLSRSFKEVTIYAAF